MLKNKITNIWQAAWVQKWWLVAAGAVCVAVVLAPTVYAKLSTSSQRYDGNTVDYKTIPHAPVALVFGAGIYDGNKPTLYLANRVRTAVQLYKAGRVDHLVMTGDNGTRGYDEPTVMKKYAISLGMDASKITLDYAGFNTYASCYRAKNIFQLTKVTVVTQGYHLPRAVMTCSRLGLQTVGVSAVHQHERDWKVAYIIREYGSTDKAIIQVITKPKPLVLGKLETVPLTE